jgi:hypothetical protein
MPNVPLPFVITLLLLILFVRFARRADGAAADRWFLALIGLCSVQSVLAGLRWGYDLEAIRFVMPVTASAVPPLVFMSFAGLTRSRMEAGTSALWAHAVPPVLVAALVVLWRAPIDLVLTAVYLAYAVALLRMAGKGPDALGGATLEGAVPAHRALLVAGLALLCSALRWSTWPSPWISDGRAAATRQPSSASQTSSGSSRSALSPPSPAPPARRPTHRSRQRPSTPRPTRR